MGWPFFAQFLLFFSFNFRFGSRLIATHSDSWRLMATHSDSWRLILKSVYEWVMNGLAFFSLNFVFFIQFPLWFIPKLSVRELDLSPRRARTRLSNFSVGVGVFLSIAEQSGERRDHDLYPFLIHLSGLKQNYMMTYLLQIHNWSKITTSCLHVPKRRSKNRESKRLLSTSDWSASPQAKTYETLMPENLRSLPSLKGPDNELSSSPYASR
jgi:fucose 4-O-acetylase-like acetyltransferase